MKKPDGKVYFDPWKDFHSMMALIFSLHEGSAGYNYNILIFTYLHIQTCTVLTEMSISHHKAHEHPSNEVIVLKVALVFTYLGDT